MTFKINDFIVGNSPLILELKKLLTQVSDTDASILILGESGTGKELVARAIHNLSSRSSNSFIPVNCGAIPKDLLETELFGHKKGAFTGAYSDRKGRFHLADKGTIFLDEIGDMQLDMQVKLLRVLQEKVVDPVGSNSPVKVDVRVVAATHQNIELLIKEGKFREDLYYRINVIPIEIPPLRSRIEDIDLLINKFIEKNTIHFDESVISYLKAYHWPGNIRELINFIQRIKAIANTNKIKLEEIPDFVLPRIDANLKNNSKVNNNNNIKKESIDFNDLLVDANSNINNNDDNEEYNSNTIPKTGVDFKKSVTDLEVSLIKEALKKSDGNVTKAAKLLTLGRTTLIEKINKYKLNWLNQLLKEKGI